MKKTNHKGIILFACAIVFFTSMIGLSVGAQMIHRMRLPHVLAERVSRKEQDYGMRVLVLSKDCLHEGEVYMIVERTINGTERFFVQTRAVEVGQELDGYFEIKEGLMINQLVIAQGADQVENGQEIWYELRKDETT